MYMWLNRKAAASNRIELQTMQLLNESSPAGTHYGAVFCLKLYVVQHTAKEVFAFATYMKL